MREQCSDAKVSIVGLDVTKECAIPKTTRILVTASHREIVQLVC